MNVIFVDIDGPLLPGKMHLFPINRKIERSKLNEAEPMFDQFAVRCFNLWAKYGNAKVVFSTNWATALNDPKTKLPEIMKNNGLEFDYHEDILTPKKFTSYRGSEIWWWMIDNMKDGDKFIAVDDDTSCGYIADYIKPREQDKHFPNDVHKPKVSGEWIEVDFSTGLTYKNFIKGCEALNIDMDDMVEKEFGIKPQTEEEKIAHAKALDMLIHCMV